jgi:DNA excision repair protein ERCC-2
MVAPESIFFPYDKFRPVQDALIDDVIMALGVRKNLIAHAPTGLGKTAAVMAPAIAHAMKNDLTVIFLTSRHTQHVLAVDTVREMSKRHNTRIIATDIIGKRWMCPELGASSLFSSEFAEYCRRAREDQTCAYYTNTRSGAKLSTDAKTVLEMLEHEVRHTEALVELCQAAKCCPYELAIQLASKSRVIIADYNYVFHPSVRENFFKRSAKELSRCILVVDEAHNLPARVREQATARLSTVLVQRAITEARRFGSPELVEDVEHIGTILHNYAANIETGKERLLRRDDFMNKVRDRMKYEDLIEEFEDASELVFESQRQSTLATVAQFLQAWEGPEDGFARILQNRMGKRGPMVVLQDACMDPSLITAPIIDEAYCTILMSGTLTPTGMYRDLLGVSKPKEVTYESPFPESNRLNLIIPKTTTKFTARSVEQYKSIAAVCADISNAVPGNSILFFPSYEIRDTVYKYFHPLSMRTCFLEKSLLTKEEKKDLLERFKGYQSTGAVLLAVSSGSFSEGIDLPGDLLKGVVIVGLPLQSPDLETQELIKYYDAKFGKGWDYGYIFPAFNKALQSAGRCIRSETDRGVVVFLDERYLWPRYRMLFPPDWEMRVSKHYVEEIDDFFAKSRK